MESFFFNIEISNKNSKDKLIQSLESRQTMNLFQSSFYSFKMQERVLVKISIASVLTVSTQGINSTHKNELKIGKQNFKISRHFFQDTQKLLPKCGMHKHQATIASFTSLPWSAQLLYVLSWLLEQTQAKATSLFLGLLGNGSF